MGPRNASVFDGSARSASVSWPDSGAGGCSCGMIGSWFMLLMLSPARLLGRGLLFVRDRGLERVPCKTGAFHANRKFPDACKTRELSHILHGLFRRGRHHAMKPLEHGIRLRDGASFHHVGHHRGGCLRDRAAGAFERGVADHVALHLQVQGQPIAAKRVVALGPMVRIGERVKVPRPSVVVEDNFLIQIREVGHQPNTSCTRCSARPIASSSSRVLYIASEARAVAGMPKRSMTGCAQWCPVRMATPSRSTIVPMSCGWMPSITNDRMLAFCRAVPMIRMP